LFVLSWPRTGRCRPVGCGRSTYRTCPRIVGWANTTRRVQSFNTWQALGRQKHINVESPQCRPSERPEEYRSYRYERRDVSGVPWRQQIHLDDGIMTVELTEEDTGDERVMSKFRIQPRGTTSLIYHQLRSSRLYIRLHHREVIIDVATN